MVKNYLLISKSFSESVHDKKINSEVFYTIKHGRTVGALISTEARGSSTVDLEKEIF